VRWRKSKALLLVNYYLLHANILFGCL